MGLCSAKSDVRVNPLGELAPQNEPVNDVQYEPIVQENSPTIQQTPPPIQQNPPKIFPLDEKVDKPKAKDDPLMSTSRSTKTKNDPLMSTDRTTVPKVTPNPIVPKVEPSLNTITTTEQANFWRDIVSVKQDTLFKDTKEIVAAGSKKDPTSPNRKQNPVVAGLKKDTLLPVSNCNPITQALYTFIHQNITRKNQTSPDNPFEIDATPRVFRKLRNNTFSS